MSFSQTAAVCKVVAKTAHLFLRLEKKKKTKTKLLKIYCQSLCLTYNLFNSSNMKSKFGSSWPYGKVRCKCIKS